MDPAAPAPAPAVAAAPVEDETPVIRAIFRDGQRLLFYAVNFGRMIAPQRVSGHARIYEAVLALALIRLHSGLGRLIHTQMPLARASGTDGDEEANWRDMLIYLRSQYPRLVLPADALFLTDMTRLRGGLARGEILTVDIRQLGRLAELGNTIFTQLDPGYQRWEPDPERDGLPAAAAPPASAAAAAPASAPLPHLLDSTPVTTPTPVFGAAPAGTAAGAQRPRPVFDEAETLYCPTCGREVLADDLWCPRCGTNFTAPGAAQPGPEPPALATAPGPSRRRGVFARLLGVR
jgi:hypothetical protein